MTHKVTSTESLGVRLTRLLRNSGFVGLEPQDIDHPPNRNDFFVQLPVFAEKSWWHYFVGSKVLFFGTLFLNDPRIGAKLKHNWIMHINGQNNMAQATQVAEELRKTFQVNVHIRLIRDETPKWSQRFYFEN